MAKITAAGDAARAALASLPEFAGGDKPISQLSDAYAHRLLRGAEKALASGATPSRQAARGHVYTPEHPSNARPKLPEPARTYTRRAEQSKYAPAPREPGGAPKGPSRPSQRVTGALPEAPRPRRHNRPPFEGHIPFSDTGEIYTRRTQREAEGILTYARGLEPVGRARLTMQVYDCSKAHWYPVLAHTWRSGGIAIDDFDELWRDHGDSLEDYLIDQINGHGANPSGDHAAYGRISHICLYEITILPRALNRTT